MEVIQMIIKKDKLTDKLNMYKKQNNMLLKKLRIEKIKFYRNRKLFERIIDEVIFRMIDESRLKETMNLTFKNVKEELMKEYDKDIK